MILKCSVCDVDTSKYKCSRCYKPYCSLTCWKQHSNSPEICIKKEKENDCRLEETTVSEFITEDTVSSEKLLKLGESEIILSMLKNPHLREILNAVDKASNAGKAVHHVMQEPIFVEFIDECLKIVEDDSKVS